MSRYEGRGRGRRVLGGEEYAFNIYFFSIFLYQESKSYNFLFRRWECNTLDCMKHRWLNIISKPRHILLTTDCNDKKQCRLQSLTSDSCIFHPFQQPIYWAAALKVCKRHRFLKRWREVILCWQHLKIQAQFCGKMYPNNSNVSPANWGKTGDLDSNLKLVKTTRWILKFKPNYIYCSDTIHVLNWDVTSLGPLFCSFFTKKFNKFNSFFSTNRAGDKHLVN